MPELSEMDETIVVNAKRIDFIFDTYVTELSVKDSERLRRCKVTPIELSMISTETPLLKDFEAFRVSSQNKDNGFEESQVPCQRKIPFTAIL